MEKLNGFKESGPTYEMDIFVHDDKEFLLTTSKD